MKFLEVVLDKIIGENFEFIILKEKDINSFKSKYDNDFDDDWFIHRYEDFKMLTNMEFNKKDFKLVVYYDNIFKSIYIGCLVSNKFYDRGEYLADVDGGGGYCSDDWKHIIYQKELVKLYVKSKRKEKLKNLYF